MNHIKISNFQTNGVSDYKGLNTDQVVPGSQFQDEPNNIYYIAYKSNIVEHSDIQVINEVDYSNKKQQLQTPIVPVETQLQDLRSQIKTTNDTLDFLLLG